MLCYVPGRLGESSEGESARNGAIGANRPARRQNRAKTASRTRAPSRLGHTGSPTPSTHEQQRAHPRSRLGHGSDDHLIKLEGVPAGYKLTIPQ